MPTIEERARDILNEVAVKRDTLGRWWSGDTRSSSVPIEALCRALEAHDATLAEFEAFKREVSDAVEQSILGSQAEERLGRFILPKPVDPLVEAIREASVSDADDGDASRLLAALAKRGLKLVEVGDAD